MKKPPMIRSIPLCALPAILIAGRLFGQTDPVPVDFNAKPLYNGNITSMQWRITQPYGTVGDGFEGIYLYDYDEKYQLKEAVWGQRDVAGRVTIPTNTFRLTGLEYDANGNVRFLRRYDAAGGLKDDFVYSYKVNTNQLSNITGHATYHYNKIGQLNQELGAAGQDKYVQYDVTGKVTAVYAEGSIDPVTGEATFVEASKKVSYTYDDRGFRLTSKNHDTGITTWYIRDASGNVMSIYEEKDDPGDLVQKEVPLYGPGKIGTYYADQDGSVAYELTDHLGNVRAVMSRRNVTFTATMEDTGIDDLKNPRVEEMQYFLNLQATELPNAGALNHTAGGSYAAYLDGSATKTIGPAITLQVKAGDKVSMKAFGKYEDQASYSTPLAIADLADALTGTYLGLNGQESALQLADIFTSSLTGFANDGASTTRPLALLNFIYFDNNFRVLDAQKVQLDAAAAFSPGQESMVDFDKLENAVDITLPGYLYVYLSNHTPASHVWFDDLTVTLTEDIVTQATDYYPFGMLARRLNTPNSYFEAPTDTVKRNFGQYYRYGYQGQFSEEDSETGWNSFELRNYDATIGRWTTMDPYGPYPSPYVGIGNDPINGIDPDGGCVDSNGKSVPCPDGISEEGNENTRILDHVNVMSPVGDKAKFEFRQRMQSGSWLTSGIHTNHFETQWQRDFETFASAGTNAISATIAMPFAATMLGGAAAEAAPVVATAAADANYVTTLAYLRVNGYAVSSLGLGSVALGKVGTQFIRTRPVQRIRATHTWLRGPIGSLDKVFKDFKYGNTRLLTRPMTPEIPADPTGGLSWGLLYRFWKTTPE